MKGGRDWKESSRLMRLLKKGVIQLLYSVPSLVRAQFNHWSGNLRDEGGHGMFGVQMRVNCGEMAGNKVEGQKQPSVNRWGLL